MYTTELVSQLKKSNVSVDGEKTKQRVEALWKGAKREQKAQILALADVVRATLYRVYETGGISAKLVVAMAQILDVSPSYLTGASDSPTRDLENGECTDAVIAAFLNEKGYQKLVEKYPSTVQNKRQRVRRASDRKVAAIVLDSPSVAENSDFALPSSSALTDEEVVILLRALLIKAKTDEKAAATAITIRHNLLS